MLFLSCTVVRKMPRYNSKRGMACLPQSWRPSAKVIPPKSQKPLAKALSSLWVQFSDIHPTSILFSKDKFPDRFMFSPVAIAPSLNMSRPSAKTTSPLA
jgi:hypothetical protein